jgi:putative copper resistance protein D
MDSFTESRKEWLRRTAAVLLFGTVLFVLATAAQGQSQSEHQAHEGHGGMSMPGSEEPMTAAMRAKLLADKAESEFNHHLAGFFVALAGLVILFQNPLIRAWPAIKYAWPACFLLSGIFLLVWSDTELWPFGRRQWLEALAHNPEVLQHKTYAALLLGLGVIEWRRASGALKSVWSGWVFPAVAIGGSVLLLFHQHEAGMHGPDHMEVMARIQSEHLSYVLAGLAIGLTKGLAEVQTRWERVFAKLFPLLMIALGALLMLYRE